MVTEFTPEAPAAWQTRASFLLEFQTRAVEDSMEEQTLVVFQETGEQHPFAGLCSQPVQDWMLEKYRSSQSELASSAAGATASEEHQPEESQTETSQAEGLQPDGAIGEAGPPTQPDVLLTLDVKKVRLFQPHSRTPIVVEKGIPSLPTPLFAEKVFDLELFFALPELAQLTLSDQVIYTLEGFAKSISSPGVIVSLGESQPGTLEARRTDYQATLTNISLPPGLYRVQLLISFMGAPIPFGLYDIPRFQVVQ